jgi:6-phosphogluconolactonase (cycloisomerase 2 family)
MAGLRGNVVSVIGLSSWRHRDVTQARQPFPRLGKRPRRMEELLMMHRRVIGGVAGLVAVLAVAIPGVATAHDGIAGYVYTETNASGGNAILGFAHSDGGALSAIGSFPTNGLGTGGALATQGEVILAGDGRWLLGVNAGSNDITVFRVRDDGRLDFSDRVSAMGTDPVSVTAHDELVYVLDAGGSGNIAGFRLDDGKLQFLAGSTRPLSGVATNPAEVAFSTSGRFLVVTERATNMLDTYKVSSSGLAGSPITTASSGPVPYGFAFDNRNHPIVSEAANSTLSSYRLSSSGATVISASVPTGGLAACWIAVTPNGRWAFDTNAHGGTISSFAVHSNGSIALAHSVAANTGAGSTPLDLQVSSDGRFLYVNEAGAHVIGGYQIDAGGTLVAVPGAPVLPAGASGIAVS